MVALLKSPPQPDVAQGRAGVWQASIEGRFRPISTHQLALAWWLYQAKHITKRQLRIYFAAHEMFERRRYAKPDPDSRDGKPRRPNYTIEEVMALIGARDSGAALTAISADVKALGRLGLVKIRPHAIDMATTINQLEIDDDARDKFRGFFERLPNQRRTVPVPRRTVRALAGGFPASVMGVMIGLMIRCLFWHKTPTSGGRAGGRDDERAGAYRVDGRTKASWFVEVFMLGSERSVTDARARLTELGWLSEIECQQWQRNRYGKYERIHTDAFGPRNPRKDTQQEEQEEGVPRQLFAGESATPTTDNPARTATPCLNSSSSSSMNLNTRKPAPKRSGPPEGSREKMIEKALRPPRLANVVDEDLRDNGRLLELHRQAIEQGVPVCGEAGRLDFFALAERARAGGKNPPKLFAWLLKHRHFDRIATADEDAAAARIRQLHFGEDQRREQGGGCADELHPRTSRAGGGMNLTADERFVLACIKVGRANKLDPFRIARTKGWDKDKWDTVRASYEQKDRQRWSE